MDSGTFTVQQISNQSFILLADEAATGSETAQETAAAAAAHGEALHHEGEAVEAAHGEEAHAAGEAHEKDSHPPEVPNFMTLIHAKYFHHSTKVFDQAFLGLEGLIFSAIGVIFVTVLVRRAMRRPTLIPSPLQNLIEVYVEGMHKFFGGILGPKHIDRFFPFLIALFTFILVNNLMGLVPLMKPSTSMIQTTGALAILTFIYVQYVGIKDNGIGGWLYHLAGSPQGVIMWVMSPLFFVLHVIGELAKPLSLALRLFGNVLGKDILLGAFVVIGLTIMYAFLGNYTWFGIPLQLPFFFLGLLLGLIQAVVFALLASIYILLMLPHDDHEHGHDEAHHAEAH